MQGVEFLLYADDLAVYSYDNDLSVTIDRLNIAISKLEAWAESMGLFLNYTKTEYMIFHKKTR